MAGPPLDRTLDPAAFYSLYRGALAAESVQRRLERCYVVILAGRLGLRPGEILHCHEGWVDWGRGELQVPALDPCACAECWAAARARQAAGDERPLEAIVTDELWSPPEEGARTIAFGWSERISGLLASFFDYLDVLDCDRGELADLVAEAAADAEGLDPDGLTPHVLRATGGRFFAEVGFDATSVQHFLGLADREDAEAYVRLAGQRTSAALYRAFDREAVGPDVPPTAPAERFPIVCDPAPFSREPFTPADFDPATRRERAKNEAGDVVRNPRRASIPDGIDYDPDEHRLAAQADPAGGQFSKTPGADAANVAALRDWIARRDASLRADSALRNRHPGVAPGMDYADLDLDPGEGPPAEPAQAATDGAAVDPGGPAAGGFSRDPETVDEAVTDPLVARVSTRFASPAVADGHPVEGQVALGQNELLLVSPGTDGRLDAPDVSFDLLPLGRVVDVVPDPEHELAAAFDSSLAVVVRREGERQPVAVELDPGRKWDFWIALFRNALHVSRMDVTHPAQVGGRVTDESATAAMLYLDRGRVRFTPIGSDSTLLAIDLDEVLHVERTFQSVEGERQRALAIRQFVDGESVTSLVGSTSERTLGLFERFVRRDYRERLEDARSLAIPDREKEILVALYSGGDALDLRNVINRDETDLQDSVDALESKDLVTAENLSSTELTAKGRLVVSDRLEAIN